MDLYGDAFMKLKKIDIREIEGFRLGNAEDTEAGTGVTVIIADDGAVAGVDVRGGGPATRETDLLRSENTVSKINAVVLSGGSAFGLEAASGVMRVLAEKGAGFRVGDISIPIVAGASLYDLEVGRNDVFPDVEMGREAVSNAYAGSFDTGNHGAGTGASVGKILGMNRAMKTGLGSFACGDGIIEVGAIAAVNACADVYSGTGNIISGLLSPDGTEIMGTVKVLKGMIHPDSKPDLELSDIKHMAAEEAKKKVSAEEISSGNEKEDIAKALMASYLQEQNEGESIQDSEAEDPVPETTETLQVEPEVIEPVPADLEEVRAEAQPVIEEESPTEETYISAVHPHVPEISDYEEPETEISVNAVPVSENQPEIEPEVEEETEGTEEKTIPVSDVTEASTVQPEDYQEEDTADEPDQFDEKPSEETHDETDEFVLSEEDKADFGYDITFNTTISCVITNAIITKSQANKLASILHDAYARAIKPVHMTLDGDTVFVMSTCTQEVNFDAFAALATDVLQYAIIDGAHSAESAYGLTASRDIIRK